MIFGIGYSKLVGTGVPDANTVVLGKSILYPNWSDPRLIEHQSVITGKRNWITLGDYASFKVKIYLDKEAAPGTVFNTLMTYSHQLVYFYPHKDGIVDGDGLGKPIKNSAGTQVKFFISKIYPYYLTNLDLYDMVNVEFIAENYVDVTKSVQ